LKREQPEGDDITFHRIQPTYEELKLEAIWETLKKLLAYPAYL